MRVSIFTGLCFVAALLGQAATAQIISQTPQPEILVPAEQVIETLKPSTPIGRPDTSIQVPRSGALLFAGFDTNHDYIIDRAEVDAGITKAFNAADKNKNNVISLVELEAWRVSALGSENATPTTYAFAPNFIRNVQRDTFMAVLRGVAAALDKDEQGELDGKIAYTDLLKNFTPRSRRKDENNCAARVRDMRRRTEQQCRSNRR